MKRLSPLMIAIALTPAIALADESVETPAGTLTIAGAYGTPEVTLGGAPLFIGPYASAWVEQDANNGSLILLGLNNGGRACPSDFAILDTTQQPPLLTQSFSNCAEQPGAVEHKGGGVDGESMRVILSPWQDEEGREHAGLIADYQGGVLTLRRMP